MRIKYIGEDTSLPVVSLNQVIPVDPIEVKKGEYYDIDVTCKGPLVEVNGVRQIPENSTLWVVFLGRDVRLPYAPARIKKYWDVNI